MMNLDPLAGDDPETLADAFDRVAVRLDKLAKRSRRDRQMIAAGLVVVAVVGGLVAWVIVLTLQSSSQTTELKADQAAIAAGVAQQHRQAATEERKLCVSFGKLAALKPPAAGDPAREPAKVFLQGLHVRLDEIGADVVDCKPASGQ